MKDNHKTREGIVVSNKMSKTVVVAVERHARDAKFKKIVLQVKKVKAHDEKNECKIGDFVQIVETRPISKDKCWRVQKIISSGGIVDLEKAAV
jgi:small subunit ribosomal protein S17